MTSRRGNWIGLDSIPTAAAAVVDVTRACDWYRRSRSCRRFGAAAGLVRFVVSGFAGTVRRWCMQLVFRACFGFWCTDFNLKLFEACSRPADYATHV